MTRQNEIEIGGCKAWTENGLLYIQTPDGRITGLNKQQAEWVTQDLLRSVSKASRSGQTKVNTSFRKYGREDGTE